MTVRTRVAATVAAAAGAAALTCLAAPAYAAPAPVATATAGAPAGASSPAASPTGAAQPTLAVLPVPVRLGRPSVVVRWSCTSALGVSVLASQPGSTTSPARSAVTDKGYRALTCDGAVHWTRLALSPLDPGTPFLAPGPVTLTAVTDTGITSTATTTVRPAWGWH